MSTSASILAVVLILNVLCLGLGLETRPAEGRGMATVSARRLLHEGRGVNKCSRDEDAPRKRDECIADRDCEWHTNCGCIPNVCSCGQNECIFTHANEESNQDDDVVDLDAVHEHTHSNGVTHSHAGGDKDHTHDENEGHSHVHGGAAHSHEGGDRQHHHLSTGETVFDDVNRNFGNESDTGGSGKRKAHGKVSKFAMITAVLGSLVCICAALVLKECIRRRGRTMLSKEMFNDWEMQTYDWESKSQAAGWKSDGL